MFKAGDFIHAVFQFACHQPLAQFAEGFTGAGQIIQDDETFHPRALRQQHGQIARAGLRRGVVVLRNHVQMLLHARGGAAMASAVSFSACSKHNHAGSNLTGITNLASRSAHASNKRIVRRPASHALRLTRPQARLFNHWLIANSATTAQGSDRLRQ